MYNSGNMVLSGAIIIACLVLAGCSVGSDSPLLPAESGGDSVLQPKTAVYTGLVDLPGEHDDFTGHRVLVGSGIYEVSADGRFEAPMNNGTTGLITVLDETGQPVLFKVFPKHELLAENIPVVNAESTALAYMYLNPILARFNTPLAASSLLEGLRMTDAASRLTSLIESSPGEVDNEEMWRIVADGLGELMANVDDFQPAECTPERSAQADQNAPWFFDRDGEDKDSVSITGFAPDPSGETASFNYQNDSYKWWMAAIDPASGEPDYTPDYQELCASDCVLGYIPPADFSLPPIDDLIALIIDDTLGKIIGNLTSNEEEFLAQLWQMEIQDTLPAFGEITFDLPPGIDTLQLSMYSIGYGNDLSTTIPSSPDRTARPIICQIFWQFVNPILAVIYDVDSYTEVEDIEHLFNLPAFFTFLEQVQPLIDQLEQDLYNDDTSAALHDIYAIIIAIMNDELGMWFIRQIIFKGELPETNLIAILTKFLPFYKSVIVCGDISSFLLGLIKTYDQPNFDNYVIDLSKYTSATEPVALADANPLVADIGEVVQFFDDGSYDPDGGQISLYEWDLDHDEVFEVEGATTSSVWMEEGIYLVQFRVTDDEGETDQLDEPLEITIQEDYQPTGYDITPPDLNFSPWWVSVEGDYAYVGGLNNGLHIFNVSDPGNPVWINKVEIEGSALWVKIYDGHLYLSASTGGFYIFDLSNPEMPAEVNKIDVIAMGFHIDPDEEYVYLCDASDLRVIDITDPSTASIVKTIDIPGWQSFDVYVDEGYAHVACRQNGLQIVDIDPLEEAHYVSTVNSQNAYAVYAKDGYAYLCDTESGLNVIDVDPPESAHVVYSIWVDTNGVYGSGNLLYATGGWGSFTIYDISDPELPSYIFNVPTPGSVASAFIGESYAYVCDTDGLQVLDIDPPGSASIVGVIQTPGWVYDVDIDGDYAFCANSMAGLCVVDISTPHSAHIVHTVDTLLETEPIEVQDGYAFAGSRDDLYIFDVSTPESSYLFNSVYHNLGNGRMQLDSGYAYTTLGRKLTIFDIDPPDTASLLCAEEPPVDDDFYCVAVEGDYAYVTGLQNELYVYDVSEPWAPVYKTSIESPEVFYASGVAVSGEYVFVLGTIGMYLINISNPLEPYIEGTVDVTGTEIVIDEDTAYIPSADGYLRILDIDPPLGTYMVAEMAIIGKPINVDIRENLAYLGCLQGGLRIIQLQ